MMPARLTSGLLARKGEARPSEGLDGPACTLVQPLPPGGALSRPASVRTPVVEILVPARSPAPALAGSGGAGAADRVNLTVRIDRTLHTRLRVLAARQQRTNQDIVEGALEAYLNVFGAGCACVRDPKRKA
jgi:hypothetical protein